MKKLVREDGIYTITLKPQVDIGVRLEYDVIVPEDLRDCQDEVTLIRTLIERGAVPIEGSWKSVTITHTTNIKTQPLVVSPKE